MAQQRVSVGRIVHYTNLGDADGRYPPEQQAALVTGVDPADPDKADLLIFYRTGIFHMLAVPRADGYERGHWSWPPYVPPVAEGTA